MTAAATARVPWFGLALAALWCAATAAPMLMGPDSGALNIERSWSPPSSAHFLGCDGQGRDVAARLAAAAGPTLTAMTLSVACAMLIGAAAGMAAGLAGGWVDAAVQLSADVFFAFPRLVLALALAAATGGGIAAVVAAFAMMCWPAVAAPVRAQTIGLRRENYILAAEALGASAGRIVLRHVLPGLAAGLSAQVGTLAAQAILLEAAMSFLGLGPPEPAPSWGGMVRDGLTALDHAPATALSAGAAIFLAALCANLLADWAAQRLDRRPSALAAAKMDAAKINSPKCP